MANIIGFVGIGVSSAALLLAILAVALTLWQSLETGSTTITAGLWKYCIETGSSKACTDLDSDTSMYVMWINKSIFDN